MKVKHLQDKTTIELTASELQDWIKRAKQLDWMLDTIRETNDMYLSDVNKLESIRYRLTDLLGLEWSRDKGYIKSK
jgi:hypothetical protein